MCKRTRAKERHSKPILMIISALESCLARILNFVEDEKVEKKRDDEQMRARSQMKFREAEKV